MAGGNPKSGRQRRPKLLTSKPGPGGENLPAKGHRPHTPGHLGPDGRREWQRLAPILYADGRLTTTNRGLVGIYCQMHELLVIAHRRLLERHDDETARLLLVATAAHLRGIARELRITGPATKATAPKATDDAQAAALARLVKPKAG